jgi:hypothetical protein
MLHCIRNVSQPEHQGQRQGRQGADGFFHEQNSFWLTVKVSESDDQETFLPGIRSGTV